MAPSLTEAALEVQSLSASAEHSKFWLHVDAVTVTVRLYLDGVAAQTARSSQHSPRSDKLTPPRQERTAAAQRAGTSTQGLAAFNFTDAPFTLCAIPAARSALRHVWSNCRWHSNCSRAPQPVRAVQRS